jgi:hypothetical protein
MPTRRRQLSMFVPAAQAAALEAVRAVVDPVQHRLIPVHVTLCREDDLPDLALIKKRLRDTPRQPIELVFGRPEVFSGHGIILKCSAGEPAFHALRQHLLGASDVREQWPHITLAHPRNPRSPANKLENALRLPPCIKLVLPAVELIEQSEGEPWQVLDRFELQPTP